MSDSHGLSSGGSHSSDPNHVGGMDSESPSSRSATNPDEQDFSAADRSALGAIDASETLRELEQDINRLQRTIRLTIQSKLRQFAGQAFGTIGENQGLVDSIAKLLDSHGLRVRCSECGHPAILRVSPRGKSHGVFVFDHTINGRRTFHGGKSCMPEVFLVAKPLRKNAPRKTRPSKEPVEKERFGEDKRDSDQSHNPGPLGETGSAKKHAS